MIGKRSWRWRDLSLRGQLMLAFAVFCLLTAGLFSLYAVAFAYTVEDEFFEALLEEQAQRQQSYFVERGRWPAIDNPAVQRYFAIADMPEELRRVLAEAPQRTEAAGAQGRHYHVLRMQLPAGNGAWLVAEVSKKLVFRRMRGTVLEILVYSTLTMLLMALVLAWYLARRTALPISRLSQTLATLDPNQLPEHLPSNSSLSEVGVLTRGLNDLVQRVREFIAREQAFTRDVSHELRTVDSDQLHGGAAFGQATPRSGTQCGASADCAGKCAAAANRAYLAGNGARRKCRPAQRNVPADAVD